MASTKIESEGIYTPVVGTLTVDLVANTAQFSGDLGKASSDAQAFGAAAESAGAKADYSMMEARHGVMLVGEEFGVHLPRALTSFIASIGPIGEALAVAFPFLAIAVGATLLIEHLTKLHEEAEKLVQSQTNFGTTVETVYSNLDDKILEAGIHVDELTHDHMAALSKQLELIDKQSLAELAHEFEVVSKSADLAFAQMKTSWYQIDGGSKGAAHALDQFKADYASLLAQGKGEEAHGLLTGTMAQAKLSLDNMKAHGDIFMDYHKKEAEAQETLIGALNAQLNVEQKIADLKSLKDSSATQTADNAVGADADKTARAQGQAAKQAAEAEQAAWEERYKAAVSQLQQSERETIEATQKGSQERLAVINSSIKEEQAKGLQDTGFYRQLLNDRVNVTREMADQQLKIQTGLAAETSKQAVAMGKLSEAADDQQAKHNLAMRQSTAQQAMNEEIRAAQEKARIDIQAQDQEISSLDKHGAEYLVKLKELEDKKKQITQQSANEVTKIRETAEEKQYQDISKAEQKMGDAVSKTVVKSILESKNMAQAFEQMGGQMIESALENMLKMIMIGDMKQARDAAHAASSAFAWVMQEVPPPAAFPMAAAAGAAAFAGVMAFHTGGEVPGMGDVPIMAQGGETVVSRALTEQVRSNTGASGHSLHYAPVIHAVDSDGVKRMLDKHSAIFHAHVTSTLRKMHKKG